MYVSYVVLYFREFRSVFRQEPGIFGKS